MQDANHAAWFAKWSSDMASNAGGSKVALGPIQALGSKAGRAAPKPGPRGPKVPAYSQGQVSKR
jgi:hypothetical protein